MAAAACVLVGLGIYVPWHGAADGGSEVLLRSERGSATPATVESAAGGHLRLRIDISDVASFSRYNIALVDPAGRVLETKTVAASGGSVSFPVEQSLEARATGFASRLRTANCSGNTHCKCNETALHVH